MGRDEVLRAFEALVLTGEVPKLGPEGRAGTRGVADVSRALDEFFRNQAVEPAKAELLRSAALLWHDHLDESHGISQGIESAEGSWLHGIMHRREPDYGNAKYWFRRVGKHPAFQTLAERAAKVLEADRSGLRNRLLAGGEWSAFGFVDECERAAGKGGEAEQVLRALQAEEIRVIAAAALG